MVPTLIKTEKVNSINENIIENSNLTSKDLKPKKKTCRKISVNCYWFYG